MSFDCGSIHLMSAASSNNKDFVKPRSVIAHCLLALLLLISQQLAVMHSVAHVADARTHTTQDKHLPADQACAQCLAFAQIDSTLTGSSLTLHDIGVDDAARVTVPRARFGPISFLASRSRAPPAIA